MFWESGIIAWALWPLVGCVLAPRLLIPSPSSTVGFTTSSSISGLICNSNNFRSHPKYACSQWFYVLSGLDSEKFVENHDMQRTPLRYTDPGSANWY